MIQDDASETRAFFEKVRQLDASRPDIDRLMLLEALRSALERAGHARLVLDEAVPGAGPLLLGSLFVPMLFWGLGAAAGVALEASPLGVVALSIGFFFAYLIPASRSDTFSQRVGPFCVIVGWLGAAAALTFSEPRALWWTHVVPIAATGFVVFGSSRLRLRRARDVVQALAGVAKSAPYVAPVVLLAVLLPALTADVWQLAAQTREHNLVAEAILSVGLLVGLVWRQLRKELEPALGARCRVLAVREGTPEQTRAALARSADGATLAVLDELPAKLFSEAWLPESAEYAPYLTAVEGRALGRPLLPRLLITTGAIGALLTAYIYALLAVTVPLDVAEGWSQTSIATTTVVSLEVPGGAYVAVAFLLGIFATAIFLAFALTEERVAAALAEALLREPIDRFLLLAVPFTRLVEWALANQKLLSTLPPAPVDDSDSSTSGDSGGDSLMV